MSLNLTHRLQQHNIATRKRSRLMIDERDAVCALVNGKPVINFSSNDYLNLCTHPSVKASLIEGVSEYGLGSGSSQLISGHYKSHRRLEEAFAEHFGYEKGLLFNSGYHANLGIFTALAPANSVFIADKFVHASLIDGMQLSQGTMRRYRHQDFNHAETLLQKYKEFPLFFVTESVFSMEGNVTDLRTFRELALKTRAFSVLDHAHGIGFIDEVKGLDCLSIPLGKAFGSMGAIVLGKEEVIEALIQFARTYCYTTALPPAISAATLTSLQILRDDTERLDKLKHLIRFFINEARIRNLDLVSDAETPIKCLLINDPINPSQKALHYQEKLLEKGFLVACIRPPTVMTSRIKISLNYRHTEEDILRLLDAIPTC